MSSPVCAANNRPAGDPAGRLFATGCVTAHHLIHHCCAVPPGFGFALRQMAFVPNAGTLTPLWGKSVPYGYWERRAGFVNEKNGGGKAAPLELKIGSSVVSTVILQMAICKIPQFCILRFAFCIPRSGGVRILRFAQNDRRVTRGGRGRRPCRPYRRIGW